ncbi:Plasmodium exported protein, unknown function [Plasmodium relictum]|uniref:Plasmodium RESA N-terminal domain-containing protein n=1 Tax=Plasmodium relictum TaxID=85471 RepID=A0A1J1GKD7_PLARL|nr:Plasmodium exported protein, unknown function [Plasmodium relictum]CRG85067.1 Plasmodium exported protein, unknown function [Plasmodium relictum]
MIYFKGSNGDLRKFPLDSNNTTIKSYSTYLHINKGETDKKKSNMFHVCSKFFTVLFLELLCFLLGYLFKEENLQNFVPKFNKDHLRVLGEKESEDVDKLIHLDEPYKKFEKSFNKHIDLLINHTSTSWEDMCYFRNVRISSYGKMWEKEKFEHWVNKTYKNATDFYGKISEEYKIFKKSHPTDKELSTFFKKKKKELYKFEGKEHERFLEYMQICIEEWIHIERTHNPKTFSSCSLFKKKGNYQLLINEQDK